MSVVFKEEQGNLFYEIGGVYKKLNNEEYLNANTLSSGLMTSEHVRRLDSIEEALRNQNNSGTTVIVENSSNLTQMVSGGNPMWMWFRNEFNVLPTITRTSDIDPQPKPSWEEWPRSTGYYHTLYSSTNRSYVMKREVPSNITEEERKVLFLELEVTTDTTAVDFMVVYETASGELKKKPLTVQSRQSRKKFIFGLDDVARYYYIVMYGVRFGVTATSLYKLGSSNEGRLGGTYQQIPRFPGIGQTYYCTDYPSGSSTKEAFLVYSGTAWREITIQ